MLRVMIVVFALLATLAAAPAAPSADNGAPLLSNPPVTLASGCHGGAQTHYVPEFRATVRHRHLKGDCRSVPMRDAIRPLDCHRDVRRHFVPGLGVVLHRHAGEDCSIRRVTRSTEPKP